MTKPVNPWFRREGLALLTDFYELTMMAGQWREKRAGQRVTFNYFFRSLPPDAGFAVFAGLESFLDYMEHLRFGEDDIEYLDSLGIFAPDFLNHLRDFRPDCTVEAVAEGTLVYPYEPILQIEGTIFEAMLIETALLNLLNFQTLVATKAARICLAANGDPVMEFGLRRAHGPDGGVSGSRAAYIGGCNATSNVLAGKSFGIPVSGTHAHSWVMSFPTELEAFRAFARHYPDRCVLLVDTYDTENSGVPNAIKVFLELRAEGLEIRPAIRLDSGDLSRLSKIAYDKMIAAGLKDPLIVASNDLDEELIADLKRQGARINAWGVGTHLITAYDAPALSGVYKLVAIRDGESWQSRMKISSNIEKATDPGRKQLVRYFDGDDQPLFDMMFLESETLEDGGPTGGRSRMWPHQKVDPAISARHDVLLKTVFSAGKRTQASPPIDDVRRHVQTQIAALPEEFKRMRNPQIYHVMLSETLGKLKDQMLSDPKLA
jgi:nicotinate phosphoribosyltransferase